MPWSIVAVGLLAACLLALFGPFGQIRCTITYLPPTSAATQFPVQAPPLSDYAQLCTNVDFRGAFYGVP